MTATVCQAHSCLFNYSRERCGAEHIAVLVQEASAFCSTFRNQGAYDIASDNDNLGMNISAAVSSDPLVECQAVSCFYNQESACYAAAIKVLGDEAVDSTDTRCKTYLPRDGDEFGSEERFKFGLHAD